MTSDGFPGGHVVPPIKLRHYRLFSRAPFLGIDGSTLVMHLPHTFGRRESWSVPLDEVAVVEADKASVVDQAALGHVFVDPPRLPYLVTTSSSASPNLTLLFCHPQRVPAVRRMAASTAQIPYRQSRSAEGYCVDGVKLRAVDAGSAVGSLLTAGAERVTSPDTWLVERRKTTTDPAIVELAAESARRTKWVARSLLAMLPLLLLARWGLARSQGWWPYPVLGGGFLLVIALPMWAQRKARRLTESLESQRGSQTDG